MEEKIDMGFRTEHDSMGEIRVDEKRMWGAQTQRSLENFRIGNEKMPREIVSAIGAIKAACAVVNMASGKMDPEMSDAIFEAGKDIYSGSYAEEFPLSVWQTGSGTQTNMNVNEVIAKIAMSKAEGLRIHPNDHVNMSQSSNDVFPSAMNIAFKTACVEKLVPAIEALIETFDTLEKENNDIVKVGRTHLQDAVPIRFGQEISAWSHMLQRDKGNIIAALSGIEELALGGTAVGTGINAPCGFGEAVAKELSDITGHSFRKTENTFSEMSSKSQVACFHSALKSLACDMMKIANDIRWLAGGPRAGLAEIVIPSNEPGSSIMPGKVNPTQCEAMTMAACQVMGNDTAVTVAASQGNFQLNVYMPVIAYNVIQSINLLSDAIASFNDNCCKGIRPNEDKMIRYLEESLMMVTALSPAVGYDEAASIAKYAYENNKTLREVVLERGIMSANEFDEVMNPFNMV